MYKLLISSDHLKTAPNVSRQSRLAVDRLRADCIGVIRHQLVISRNMPIKRRAEITAFGVTANTQANLKSETIAIRCSLV